MKTKRIYLRITPDDKQFLQKIADSEYEGNLSALFDDIIQQLKEKEDTNNGTT